MPGGNPTIKTEPLDLGSFLQRKRKPLETWLIQNSITSEQALQNLLKNPEWSVSENLAEAIRGFFVVVPVKPEQANKEEVAVDNQVIKIQTLPPSSALKEDNLKEEQLVETTSPEEMVSFVEAEEVAETRSALLNRERKKNR